MRKGTVWPSHGHTLVWHNQNPKWLTDAALTRTEVIDAMTEHIHAVAGRYRGRIPCWDVLNEGVVDDGLRKTIWLEGVGPEYVEMAFRAAHEADPDAKLFYNDFAAEELNAKADQVYALVRSLLDAGAPVHGVGFQMHIGLHNVPDMAGFRRNLARFAELELETRVTEMDVQIQKGTGSPEELLAAQARAYGDVLRTCLEVDGFTGFTTWGFTDAHSWIPKHTGAHDEPLPFDTNYAPKPAYDAIAAALSA